MRKRQSEFDNVGVILSRENLRPLFYKVNFKYKVILANRVCYFSIPMSS